ncbi:MAG: MFS transporter [Magnetococcales bacterium]|nr:MFS transporter [Magnetococcales bacterium]
MNGPVTEAELLQLVARGEDSRHQFKQDCRNGEALAAELVAFANSNGGFLIIGVSDSGHITGLSPADVNRINQLLANTASQQVKPPINPITTNIMTAHGLVIVAEIVEGINKPYLDHTDSMSRLEQIGHFLGLRRSMIGLLVMVLLIGLGERMAERFLPLYLLAVGGGTWAIGMLGGMQNLLSALYSFPGGYLSDRIGAKRALLLFNALAMVGFLIVALIPTWQAVLFGAMLFVSWSAISLPATMGLISQLLPANKRTMGISMHSMMARIPKAIGPVLGGALIAWLGEGDGVRLAMALAFLLGGIAMVLQHRLIEPQPPENSATAEKNPLRLWASMSQPLRHLLLSDILLRFCEQIPNAFVILWCMQWIAEPVTAWQFGLLTAIEMITSLLIYIPVARWADQGHKKPFVLATFLFFTAFPLVLLFSHTLPMLVLAFVVRGLKEFGEPSRKAMIVELSPDGRKAAMFGLYYLIRDVVVACAAFGGAALWQIGPEVNLLTAAAFGMLGTIWFALRVEPTG